MSCNQSPNVLIASQLSVYRFKVDRLQIILVAKNIYMYASQLFISRIPKMRAIPQLVSAMSKQYAENYTVHQETFLSQVVTYKKIIHERKGGQNESLKRTAFFVLFKVNIEILNLHVLIYKKKNFYLLKKLFFKY